MSEAKIPLAGVIGCPVAHSKSPQLQRHWLNTYGIHGHYVPLHVEPGDLENVLRTLPKMGFAGVNVTLPHKEDALALCDSLDAEAERVGAVNVVRHFEFKHVQLRFWEKFHRPQVLLCESFGGEVRELRQRHHIYSHSHSHTKRQRHRER